MDLHQVALHARTARCVGTELFTVPESLRPPDNNYIARKQVSNDASKHAASIGFSHHRGHNIYRLEVLPRVSTREKVGASSRAEATELKPNRNDSNAK